MANKVDGRDLSSLGFDALMMTTILRQYRQGPVSEQAIEFEYQGVIVSLRKPEHSKVIEGVPGELIRNNLIQTFAEMTEVIHKTYTDPTCVEQDQKDVETLLCSWMQDLYQAIMNNDVELLRKTQEEIVTYRDEYLG